MASSVFEVSCCTWPVVLQTNSKDDEELSTAERDDSKQYQQTESDSEQHLPEPPEALGWTCDAIARGVAVMGAAVFVSSALLNSAKEAAGCDIYQSDERCLGRVYGMRPSSLLTNIVMISSLVSASLLPLIGSIIDHTRYRRAVGRLSALALTVLALVQIWLLDQFWLGAAMLQVLVAFSYAIHLCSVYAYLPELSMDPDTLVKYTARFTAFQYGASVVFLLFMVVILRSMDIGIGQEVQAAQLSQCVVFGVGLLLFGFAWLRLFRKRPPKQLVPEGDTLFNAGFRRLFHTSRKIVTNYASLKWFLVSASFTQGTVTTFNSIAITYMTDQLRFNPAEIGLTILILLLSAVPGTRIATIMTNRFNPVRSLQCCIAVWIINTSLASIILRGEGQQKAAFAFAVVWGLSIGWVYPSEKTLYCSIIPAGQEAELMGVYIFACQILSWLPPFVFSLLNEFGFSMQLGLFSLNVYFAISLFVLILMGDYNAAVAHASSFDVSDAGVPSFVEGEDGDNTNHYKTMNS
jgi:UMF1 family MFS transporter